MLLDRYNKSKYIYSKIEGKNKSNPFTMKGVEKEKIENLSDNTGILTTNKINNMLQNVLDKVSLNKKSIFHNIYKDMSVLDLSERLLSKRPIVYFGEDDSFVIAENGKLLDGKGEYKYISMIKSKLLDFIHPDEAILSSYLGMILPSIVINDGSRYNNGIPKGKFSDYPPTYVAAQVGARLEVKRSDYKSIFSKKEKLNDFELSVREMLDSECKEKNPTGSDRYRARSKIILESLIKSTEKVYQKEGQKVILQITGLGLGVWSGSDTEQREVDFIMGLMDSIESMSLIIKKKIKSIQLIWLPKLTKKQKIIFNDFTGLKVIETKEAPFSKKLLSEKTPVISSFAWDGMSYLGNEYFVGLFSASGDPAMASATSISYLGSPLINPEAYKRYFN